MRERLQAFGGFMAGMVIPNIGAFIAWGLITALFIPTGWLPNMGFTGAGETFSPLVGPMIVNLLPLLIGYTGGKMIHGHRGGVLGAIMTMGVIVGSEIPMFLGGMICGPLAGWIMMKIDEALEDNIPVGFEMLINNFSIGIAGTILAMIALVIIGPIVTGISNFFELVVNGLVNARLLPLAAIIYTDISRDGMMQGTNVEGTAELAAAVKTPVIASGGVTSLEDIEKLNQEDLAGCIVGRALYEGTIRLADANSLVREN